MTTFARTQWIAARFLCFLVLLLGPFRTFAATHDVDMVNISFSPANLTIPAGDTVRWTQQDFVEHTSTSGNTPTPDGIWGSASLTFGQTFSYTFNTPGTFPYFCIPHPFNMTGAVTVEAAPMPIDNPIAERVPKGGLIIELETVVDGLSSPLGLGAPDDGSGRMFVYEQNGLVWVVAAGSKLPAPLLDVRARLATLDVYDERGLLGFAVHPDFDNNPLVYTHTSEPVAGAADFTVPLGAGQSFDNQTVIAEWRIDSGNPNLIDVASRREILRIDQPQFNHAGGDIAFGPDGNLYIGLGDGGGADDEGPGHSSQGNSQDTGNVLGSILRVDVDGNTSANGQYSVPGDNPFVGVAGVDEIYAFGFRNPFRLGFDSMTGTLYAGDVGQNKIEEVDVVTLGGNYGWRIKEGTFFFDPNGSDPGFVTDTPVVPVPPGLVDPIAQYDHDDGLAVVGGYVYRGSGVPALAGRYITGDWGSFGAPSGRLFYLTAANEVREFQIGLEDRPLGAWLKGFGQDQEGEVYVFVSRDLGPGGNTGRMLKIVTPPDPLLFTGAAMNGAAFETEWAGGRGPFALQQREAFCGEAWVNRTVTAQRMDSRPASGSAGFFRVADTGNQRAIPFSTRMSGQFERPTPVVGSATGSGTFSLEGNTLKFDIQYAGLTGTATAAHIHGSATAATGAGVLIDLAPYNGGSFGTSGSFSGALVLSDAHKAIIMSGLSYVNVHTSAHTGGELRGQIAPVAMHASFSGANERPNPVDTDGRGAATLTLVGNKLTFNLTYSGLSGQASAAHIHGPAGVDAPAGVLVDLGSFHNAAPDGSGSIQGTVTLSDVHLPLVIDGLTYINIHTPSHSPGEVRGQLLPQVTVVPLTTIISGLFERPNPVTNSAAGSGSFMLDGSKLYFDIRYDGLSAPAIAAHIHGAAATTDPAGVMINLAPYIGSGFGASGTIAGSVILSPEQQDALLSARTYVNIHTSAHTAGEIRGQIVPVLLRSGLSGSAERPDSVSTPGSGTGIFLLVRDRLAFNVTYLGLSGVASASHIHGGASTFGSAGVLINLAPFNGGGFGAAGSLFGEIAVTPAHLGLIIDGMTYINVHTGAHSAGEIRGQITR